jgi:hypothetical protein
MEREIAWRINEKKVEKRRTLPKIDNTVFMVRRTKRDMRNGWTEQLYILDDGKFYKISAESAKAFADQIGSKRSMIVWDKTFKKNGGTEIKPQTEERKNLLSDTHLMGGFYAEMKNRTGLWNTVK